MFISDAESNLNIFDVHKHFSTDFASVGVHPLLLVVTVLQVDVSVVQDQVATLVEPLETFLTLVSLNLQKINRFRQKNFDTIPKAVFYVRLETS